MWRLASSSVIEASDSPVACRGPEACVGLWARARWSGRLPEGVILRLFAASSAAMLRRSRQPFMRAEGRATEPSAIGLAICRASAALCLFWSLDARDPGCPRHPHSLLRRARTRLRLVRAHDLGRPRPGKTPRLGELISPPGPRPGLLARQISPPLGVLRFAAALTGSPGRPSRPCGPPIARNWVRASTRRRF